MTIDRLENIHKYVSVFPGITQFIKVSELKPLSSIRAKENHGDISLVPITSDGVTESFDANILEAHKTFMDIHITLEGTDIIAYADLNNEATVYKAYDEDNDFLLANSNYIKTLTVPRGYFCIIPNNFVHMALYMGHRQVKKIVVKIMADS